MTHLFRQVYVSPAVADMQRGTLVAWRMSHHFNSGGADFNILVSRSGMVDDWQPAGSVLSTESHFIHTDRQFYAVDYKLYYRVTTQDAAGREVDSGILDVTRHFTARDARIAQEIMRKETLLLNQYNGVKGILFKRRHWGVECTLCKDHDFGTPVESSCERCFGTGFVGGYHGIDVDGGNHRWVPYTLNILQEAPTAVRTEDDSGILGTVDPQAMIGRGLACPRVDSDDIWVNCYTDVRYIVKETRPVVYRNIPVAYESIQFKMLQSSDIAYKLPRLHI